MSDPFANLLTSFKNGGSETNGKPSHKSNSPSSTLSSQLQPVERKTDASSVLNSTVSSGSNKMQPISNDNQSTTLHDDFEDLFGFGSKNDERVKSSSPVPLRDDFDAAFEAFERPLQSEAYRNELAQDELIVDEVKDMEVAKLMSLDLSIDEANSYYDKGVMYEDLIKQRKRASKPRPKEPQFSRLFDDTSNLRRNDGGNLFSMASGLFNMGKEFVDQLTTFPEEDNRLTRNAPSNFHEEDNRPTRNSPSNFHEEDNKLTRNSPSNFQEAENRAEKCYHHEDAQIDVELTQPEVDPVVEGALLGEFQQKLNVSEDATRSTTYSPPQDTLLDFDQSEPLMNKNPSPLPVVPISHVELSGYNEFRDRASEFFKSGDYVSALQEYEKSLNTLPNNHPLRIVAYSNITAAQSKVGEYTKCLKDSKTALDLFPQCSSHWNQVIQDSQPLRTYNDIWPKIVARRAEAFEHTENYKDAFDSYQTLIERNFFTDRIMDGKRRCQKVLNPQKPKFGSNQSISSSMNKNTKQNIREPTPQKTYESVEKIKEENKRDKELEAEKSALYDKVHDQIEAWKGNTPQDIRYLLSNLSSVLSWCDWQPVASSDLVMPKKVKLTYMKAVAKTHPDKVSNSLPLEQKMIAENVFSALCIAWEKFKSENNIN